MVIFRTPQNDLSREFSLESLQEEGAAEGGGGDPVVYVRERSKMTPVVPARFLMGEMGKDSS